MPVEGVSVLRRIVGPAAVALLGFVIACGPEDDTEFRSGITPQPEAWIPAPLPEAYCEIIVDGIGAVDAELDYLPHVITCENGGANLEALKAQAIAARSVVYYTMANQGSICDSQGCQVYSCGTEPSALAYQAVEETAGIYLSYDQVLTYAFYVAGDSDTAPPSCVGTPGVGTEGWVTYNEGLTGEAVIQTELGWVFNPGEPGFGQNRGCMSQWGARCLENSNGYGFEDILRFYYGADIVLTQATGPCIPDVGGEDTGETGGSETSGDETDDGTSDDATDLDESDDDCVIGSHDCYCTMGGGCDPGLVCEDDICVPDGAGESDAGDETDGLPPGFGNDEADGACACTTRSELSSRSGSRPESGADLAWLGLALLGLIRSRRRRAGASSS